jgi:transposase-like protein
MDFPLVDLLDEEACYGQLLDLLHPEGLSCPRCGEAKELAVHRRHRHPVLDYRCQACGRVFNAFTGTAFQQTHRRCSELLLILRGIAQGVTTARLARELGRNRPRLLELRHAIQDRAAAALERTPLPDAVVEVDEMYQNAGEKRHAAPRPGRSTAPPGQQGQGPRHVGPRPATGLRDRRPGERPSPPGGRPAQQPRHPLPAGRAVHPTGHDRELRRVGRL